MDSSMRIGTQPWSDSSTRAASAGRRARVCPACVCDRHRIARAVLTSADCVRCRSIKSDQTWIRF